MPRDARLRGAGGGVLAWNPAARAQTDEIQVYDAEITAAGKFNLTWHNTHAVRAHAVCVPRRR